MTMKGSNSNNNNSNNNKYNQKPITLISNNIINDTCNNKKQQYCNAQNKIKETTKIEHPNKQILTNHG